jgi:hypothetical protein
MLQPFKVCFGGVLWGLVNLGFGFYLPSVALQKSVANNTV